MKLVEIRAISPINFWVEPTLESIELLVEGFILASLILNHSATIASSYNIYVIETVLFEEIYLYSVHCTLTTGCSSGEIRATLGKL